MTWQRPPLRTRYRYGLSWRKRRDTLAAMAAAVRPAAPPALSGLGDQVQGLKARAFTLTGTDTDQVRQKVQLLRDYVVAPALGPGARGLLYLRALLAEILGSAPPTVNSNRKAWLAAYLFRWIQTHIRYVNDPSGMEVFTEFPDIHKRGFGDCDDLTAFVAVLFSGVGIPVKARIIQTPNATGWSHIYPVAFLDGKWRAFDASVPNARPGWEYPDATKRQDLEVAP